MVATVDQIRRNVEMGRSVKSGNYDRITSALPTDTAVEGTFLVDGSGEALKTVNFPAIFISRPSFNTGYEFHIDSSPVEGSYPICTTVVHRWITNPPIADDGTAVDYSKVYFVGARLVVVTTGPASQRLWVHWRASGRALTNPGPDVVLTTGGVV